MFFFPFASLGCLWCYITQMYCSLAHRLMLSDKGVAALHRCPAVLLQHWISLGRKKKKCRADIYLDVQTAKLNQQDQMSAHPSSCTPPNNSIPTGAKTFWSTHSLSKVWRVRHVFLHLTGVSHHTRGSWNIYGSWSGMSKSFRSIDALRYRSATLQTSESLKGRHAMWSHHSIILFLQR